MKVIETIMYNQQEKHKSEGAKKRVPQRITPALLIVLVIMIVVLTTPLVAETRIYIKVELNAIEDVWVETVRVPLISTVFPPSHGVGVYTINVTIEPSGDRLSIEEVPSGEYVFIWSNAQSGVDYTVTVTLRRQHLIIDTFVLDVSF